MKTFGTTRPLSRSNLQRALDRIDRELHDLSEAAAKSHNIHWCVTDTLNETRDKLQAARIAAHWSVKPWENR